MTGGAGAGRRDLEARLVEAVAEHGLRVAEREAPRLRAEHDQHEVLPGLPRGDGQVVARLAREPGLERLHATRVLEERDAAAVDAAAVDERGAAQQGTRRGIVLEQALGQPGQILRGAALGGIGQAVGIGEVRVGEPELLGLGVHRGHEGVLGAAQMLGHRGGRVVGGGDGHALEQRAQRRGLAGPQAHAIARGEGRAMAHQHRVLPLRAPGVERLAGEVERHELDEARGGVVLGGPLGVEHPALGVEQENGLRAQRERPAIRAGGLSGSRRCDEPTDHAEGEDGGGAHCPYLTCAANLRSREKP